MPCAAPPLFLSIGFVPSLLGLLISLLAMSLGGGA